MQYTETQLTKLIEDVEKEFTAHLAKAEQTEPTLAKSEDGKKPLPSKDKKDEKPEESKEEKPKAAPSENQASPEHGAEAPKEESKRLEGAPVEPSGHDYDDEDMEHMRHMYSSMSQGELKAHHDCIAELAKCGGMPMGKSESEVAGGIGGHKSENPPQPKVKGDNLDNDPKNGGIEGQEPNNALGPKSPASKAEGVQMSKSERARRNGGKIEEQLPNNSPGPKSSDSDAHGDKMNKSEETSEVELLKSELTAEKSKFDDLKKNFDAVQAFLTKLVEKRPAPAAKAITDLSVLAKSEDAQDEKSLSKVEIDSILTKKASDPTLKKSDRDAINTYYLGDKDIKGISHLLK
jgi:hypothetical protein